MFGCFTHWVSDDGFTYIILIITFFNDWADNRTANEKGDKSESFEEFEKRIFSPGGTSKTDAILDKLNQRVNNRDRYSSVQGGSSQFLDDLEQTFDTLSDGMDGKLNNAARYFEFDPDEIDKEDYSFRYDTTFHRGSTYTLKVCRIAILNFLSYCCVHIYYYILCIYVISF